MAGRQPRLSRTLGRRVARRYRVVFAPAPFEESGDLRTAADAVRLSRRTLRTIKGNLFWAFAYNVAACRARLPASSAR